MQILLVEDNKAITKALTYNLEQNKYRVLCTENVAETLKILKQEKIDLIILDVTLPDGNGFDLYKTIKEKYVISTIFLTAKDEENDVVKGLELGAEDYEQSRFQQESC